MEDTRENFQETYDISSSNGAIEQGSSTFCGTVHPYGASELAHTHQTLKLKYFTRKSTIFIKLIILVSGMFFFMIGDTSSLL